jgi:NADPH-dependent 2,4-dienoyl-CoA reductase/sulfur reductase-like enzyme
VTAPLDAEVVVVGAGPAGIRAAVAASEAGAAVLLIDEAPRAGGQIYRQLPPEIQAGAGDRLGASAAKSRPLLADLERANVTVMASTEVWGVLPSRVVLAHQTGHAPIPTVGQTPGQVPGRTVAVQAGALVLATGAYDRPAAMPGWTLPGVVTAGGVTALVKAQRVLPGRRVILAGTGPLLLAAATALVRGGATVVGIAEAAPRRALAGLLRRPGIVGQSVEVMTTLWRIPIWTRRGLVRIEGTEGVERAVVARLDEGWRPVSGTERAIEVDTVVLGYGLVVSPELADLAGCAMAYDAGGGGFIPVADPDRLMATSAPGVFVAGDGAGVGGADVAEAQGRLAGLGAAHHVGKLREEDAMRRAASSLATLRRFSRFRRRLGEILAPRSGLYELATDDTTVCRCEEVSAADIRRAIGAGARQATEVRAVTRAGMGLCQGRMCIPTVCGLLGRWAGVSPETAGRFPPRLPTRPVAVPVLADPGLESIAAPAVEVVRR